MGNAELTRISPTRKIRPGHIYIFTPPCEEKGSLVGANPINGLAEVPLGSRLSGLVARKIPPPRLRRSRKDGFLIVQFRGPLFRKGASGPGRRGPAGGRCRGAGMGPIRMDLRRGRAHPSASQPAF